MSENNDLSERELEILKLVATGASNKEIAQQLYISANTVKVHLRNIFTKTGVATRTEAAMVAVQIGLVQTAAPVEIESASESGAELEGVIEPVEPDHIEIEPVPFWRLYAGWVIAAVILVVGLLGAWVVFAREPAQTATASPPAPTAEARWQLKAPLTSARSNLAVASLESYLYVIGGENGQGVLDSLDRYNPQSDTWTRLRSKPLAVADASAAVIGGKIYVPGGRLASGAMTDALEIYDPARDAWTRGADLPAPVSAYALAALEGKLFLFGGWNGGAAVAEVYRYDPGLDKWQEMTPMPTARAFAGAGVADGKIFVVGGLAGGSALAVSEVYQPSREGSGGSPWESAEPMPDPRYAMGVANVVDIIYVIGGIGELDTARSSLEYLPSSEEWQVFDLPVDQTWSNMGMVLSGSFIYLLGGDLDGAPTSQNLAYQAVYTVSIPSIIK